MRVANIIFFRGLPAALLCLSLGACAGPSFVANPESGVELRWPNGQGSIEVARNDANARCAAHARHAVLADEFMDRDETLARFYCR
jgi:hypothetical protein